MSVITNGTATSTPANALADGHNYLHAYIVAEAADMHVNIGADAGAAAGQLIKSGAGQLFTNLGGKRVSVHCGTSTAYSIREALNG